MAKFAIAMLALVLTGGIGLGSAHADPKETAAAEGELALRQSLQEALWPADIMHLSAEYLRQYPRGSWSDASRLLYERSRDSMRILARGDVHLYKYAFQPAALPPEVKTDIRKAALGDQDAAIRLAQWCRQADKATAQATNRYVGWLQFASLLGNDRASYELALHFRALDQPALASLYEARAVALGYVLPPTLDNVRK